MKKLFALVDANCFYASCERIFDPSLKWKPLVVLSNNDGCAVTRSDEAKSLWVKMGEPYFELKKRYGDKLICKSSNYTLYWEISRRFHNILSWYACWQEIYSIDESFLDFTYIKDVSHISSQIYARCKRDLWLPVCVWVGSTKTRAKLANHIAKKNKKFNGRCNFESLTSSEQIFYMRLYDVGDVWWVWRRNKDRLNSMGIYSIYDLYLADAVVLKSIFSVVMAKIILELNWESCLELEEVQEDKKQIMTSRSFWEMVEEIKDLEEAITYFCSRWWEKLRKQGSKASTISVFIQSNRFRTDLVQYWQSYVVNFPQPTDDTALLIKWAVFWLSNIFRKWIRYKKAWILLSWLDSSNFEQMNLFWEQVDPWRKILMETLDRLNSKYWTWTMKFASQWTRNNWWMKCENKSPKYLHSWEWVPICT